MKTHDAIAELPFRDAAADGDDSAGEFVAEDLRWLDVAMEDFLDVRAADATRGDFDEDFAVGDFGDGDFFDADEAFFAEDAGTHGFGDGAEGAGRIGDRAECPHTAATFSRGTGKDAMKSSKKPANR